jgi:hypothetical protein
MKLLPKFLVICAVALFIATASSHAYADGIVLASPDQKLVPPLAALNLQHSGNSTTSSGGVSWNGTRDVSFGDISAGPHQHTVLFSDLGLSRPSDLSVLLNINEANGSTFMPITVNSLTLTLYNTAGTAVFSADLINGAPITLDQFKHGQGALSDYVIFGLDTEAAARLQAAINQDSNLRLGLSASLTNPNGGPERFTYSAATQPVPEPMTLILLGTGLAGTAGIVRRRKLAKQIEADSDSSKE